jgi:uncharacterized membrane protein YdbT with pleckstrin-like domain
MLPGKPMLQDPERFVADMGALFDTLTWEQIADDTSGVMQVRCCNVSRHSKGSSGMLAPCPWVLAKRSTAYGCPSCMTHQASITHVASQEMMECVRRHQVNLRGVVSTVVVTTLVLEGWWAYLRASCALFMHGICVCLAADSG